VYIRHFKQGNHHTYGHIQCVYIRFWPTLLVCDKRRLRNDMCRVGQNCIYAPYMTVYLVISLPKIPYIHRIYMVLANPRHVQQRKTSSQIVLASPGRFSSQTMVAPALKPRQFTKHVQQKPQITHEKKKPKKYAY